MNLEELWDYSSIATRFPVKSVSNGQMCSVIEVDGKDILFCNLHLAASPFQPYQLLGIPGYGVPITTEEAAIAYSEVTRGKAIDRLLEEIESYEGKYETIIITGDFNEPSHRDWTEKAAIAGMHPLKVEYPQTKKLEDAGFIDAYREIYPDEVENKGWTLSPVYADDDKSAHPDRIDFIFVKGAKVVDVKVIGEESEHSDLKITPWPSDHRAVMATLEI